LSSSTPSSISAYTPRRASSRAISSNGGDVARQLRLAPAVRAQLQAQQHVHDRQGDQRDRHDQQQAPQDLDDRLRLDGVDRDLVRIQRGPGDCASVTMMAKESSARRSTPWQARGDRGGKGALIGASPAS
jgi:hypothetical protein